MRFTVFALIGLLFFAPVARAQDVAIPNFWDTNERFTKPDLSRLPRLRFLTTTDFPPFNFVDRQKGLAGFHVDLARAICAELDVLNRCEIQAIPWAELTGALEKEQGEAIIAGLAVTKEAREKLNFSRPYLHIPARFVVRKADAFSPPAYDALFRKKIGLIGDTAHSAYFSRVFANRTAVTFETRAQALNALKAGEVDAVFSDAVSLSFWLSSAAAEDCCEFLDGPYLSPGYFGNGLAIALPQDRPELVEAMNYALSRINDNETFAEIYLRYFPIGLF